VGSQTDWTVCDGGECSSTYKIRLAEIVAARFAGNLTSTEQISEAQNTSLYQKKKGHLLPFDW